jgi:hypothetical protein
VRKNKHNKKKKLSYILKLLTALHNKWTDIAHNLVKYITLHASTWFDPSEGFNSRLWQEEMFETSLSHCSVAANSTLLECCTLQINKQLETFEGSYCFHLQGQEVQRHEFAWRDVFCTHLLTEYIVKIAINPYKIVLWNSICYFYTGTN